MSEPASSLDKQVREGLKDLNQSLNIYFVFFSCHHKINETNINRVGNVLRTMRHSSNHDILISIFYKLINFITAQRKRKDLYDAVSSFSRHPTMSLVMRKPAFCICENKDADQLRGNREADQRLCFRYTDSTILLLPTSEISSL